MKCLPDTPPLGGVLWIGWFDLDDLTVNSLKKDISVAKHAVLLAQ